MFIFFFFSSQTYSALALSHPVPRFFLSVLVVGLLSLLSLGLPAGAPEERHQWELSVLAVLGGSEGQNAVMALGAS